MTLSGTYEFPSPILKREAAGHMAHHYMPIPAEYAEKLIESGTRRVILTVNDRSENRAINRSREGEYFLILGLPVLRRLAVKLGDVIIAGLRSDPNPDQVDLPAEFREVLDQDTEAAERYFTFTPGKQRSISTYITQAKRSETRIKRSLEMAHKLKTYTLHGDTPPSNEQTS